jgi:SAM-dependent methyltransferase
MSKAFWDERYAGEQLVYGAEPNAFLASAAKRFPPTGRALDIGAGEGRNALYLASLGLDVLAVDQSDIGMQKASRLARDRGLALRTQAADLADFDAPPASFDIVSSIFVHLPRELRQAVHGRLRSWLRPGGIYVMEAYAPDQLRRSTGGPKDPALLAPLDTILAELDALHIEHHAALVRVVEEGQYHTGEASVVQVVARRE